MELPRLGEDRCKKILPNIPFKNQLFNPFSLQETFMVGGRSSNAGCRSLVVLSLMRLVSHCEMTLDQGNWTNRTFGLIQGSSSYILMDFKWKIMACEPDLTKRVIKGFKLWHQPDIWQIFIWCFNQSWALWSDEKWGWMMTKRPYKIYASHQIQQWVPQIRYLSITFLDLLTMLDTVITVFAWGQGSG